MKLKYEIKTKFKIHRTKLFVDLRRNLKESMAFDRWKFLALDIIVTFNIPMFVIDYQFANEFSILT